MCDHVPGQPLEKVQPLGRGAPGAGRGWAVAALASECLSKALAPPAPPHRPEGSCPLPCPPLSFLLGSQGRLEVNMGSWVQFSRFRFTGHPVGQRELSTAYAEGWRPCPAGAEHPLLPAPGCGCEETGQGSGGPVGWPVASTVSGARGALTQFGPRFSMLQTPPESGGRPSLILGSRTATR